MMRTVTVKGLDIVVHERTDWQTAAEPIKGPAASPDLVHTAVCHYPGAGDAWVPPADVAAHLRSQQHWGLGAKGYSYWYNFVIGPNPFPDIWEVRGFDIRNAANNGDKPPYSDYENPNWNGHSVSIQIMCSVAHPPTADQIKSFQYCLAMCDDFYGETLELIGHRDSDLTDCPGPAYPLVTNGTLATRPPEEGDLASSDEILAAITALDDKVDALAARVDEVGENSWNRDKATRATIAKLLKMVDVLPTNAEEKARLRAQLEAIG